jgi:hypothetical protein
MPTPDSITLRKLPLTLYVMRLPAARPIARWMLDGPFVSVTRTAEELSVIVEASRVPPGIQAEGPFATYKVDGPLDFALTGIVARITAPLAVAEIPVFVTSTFDTDYVLVREGHAGRAEHCWREAGLDLADGR